MNRQIKADLAARLALKKSLTMPLSDYPNKEDWIDAVLKAIEKDLGNASSSLYSNSQNAMKTIDTLVSSQVSKKQLEVHTTLSLTK